MGDEADFLFLDNTKVFHKLIVPFWVYPKYVQISTRSNKFPIGLQDFKKTWSVKLVFCLKICINGFFKFILLFLVCVDRHAQITQNNKFDISLQYLKKEVDFLHSDEHESFLQIDTMIFAGDGQAFPNFPKEQVSNVFTIFQKRS